MSLLTGIGRRLFRAGLRRPAAAAASAAYSLTTNRNQRFWIDEHGHWVNQQLDATVVSPIPHTSSFFAYSQWVLDNWAYKYLPKAGDTVIDVGAGVGEEAITFSKLVGPSGRVICVEAHPETYACLVETIRLSGLANVVPIFAAVSDVDGTATIGSVGNFLANSIMAVETGIEVQARSLDSIADEYAVTSAALIKMNIEGAEQLAVEGMERLATRTCNICVSCHDFVADRDGDDAFRTKKAVRKTLERLGFEISTRPQHEHAWVRDYLYGARSQA
jgi:FkbM family methyltransferase